MSSAAESSEAAALSAGHGDDDEDVGDAAAVGDAVDDDDADCICDIFAGEPVTPPTLTTRRSGESEPPSTDARAINRQGLSYLCNTKLHNHAEFDARDRIHKAAIGRRSWVAFSSLIGSGFRFCFAQKI